MEAAGRAAGSAGGVVAGGVWPIGRGDAGIQCAERANSSAAGYRLACETEGIGEAAIAVDGPDAAAVDRRGGVLGAVSISLEALNSFRDNLTLFSTARTF